MSDFLTYKLRMMLSFLTTFLGSFLRIRCENTLKNITLIQSERDYYTISTCPSMLR